MQPVTSSSSLSSSDLSPDTKDLVKSQLQNLERIGDAVHIASSCFTNIANNIERISYLLSMNLRPALGSVQQTFSFEIALANGEHLLYRRRFKDLETWLEKNKMWGELDIHYLFIKAKFHYMRKDFIPADHLLKEILQKEPHHQLAWICQICIAIENGDLDSASQLTHQALQRLPNHFQLLELAIEIQIRKQNYEDAKKFLEYVLGIYDDYSETRKFCIEKIDLCNRLQQHQKEEASNPVLGSFTLSDDPLLARSQGGGAGSVTDSDISMISTFDLTHLHLPSVS